MTKEQAIEIGVRKLRAYINHLSGPHEPVESSEVLRKLVLLVWNLAQYLCAHHAKAPSADLAQPFATLAKHRLLDAEVASRLGAIAVLRQKIVFRGYKTQPEDVDRWTTRSALADLQTFAAVVREHDPK